MTREVEWRDVVGFEDRYEVSSTGLVKSKSYLKHGFSRSGPISFWTKPRPLRPGYVDGYLQVVLSNATVKKKRKGVHQLVAEAFIPNPCNKPQVNHKNSVRDDNTAGNLEWVTCQENVQHSYDHGFASNTGELHPRAVLDDETVGQIRELKKTLTGGEIAAMLNIKKATVYAAASKRRWAHVV